MRAKETFDRLLREKFHSVLDIGAGDLSYAVAFNTAGKSVTTVNLYPPADYVGDYMQANLGMFDCIWACHVLEHQRNIGAFLDKCFKELKTGGFLAVTVPPMKTDIVGGHLSLWNAGLLLYHLILAGFDCSSASVKSYGYNISVIVRKRPACLPPLKMDFGDIESISKYFPFKAAHGFDGNIQEINW